jgi:hypothetical protein
VIKYSTQIIKAGSDGDGADRLGAGDGDGEGVSGGSGDGVRDIKWLGGGSCKRGVGGVRTGGPGTNGNCRRASARSREGCEEDVHGVDKILLHLEGVADVEVLGRSGRLWWCRRGGLPAGGDLAVKLLPGFNPGLMLTTLGGRVARSNSGTSVRVVDGGGGCNGGSIVGDWSLKLSIR